MDIQEPIEAASSFLLQSPPGEVNDVLNDIRQIIQDDDALQAGIRPALQQYNETQFVTIEIPGVEHQVIISEAGRVEGTDRYVDPRSKQTFEFDHLQLAVANLQPHEPDAESETFREALQNAAIAYVADHFHDGHAAVFTLSPSRYALQVVANKYNPANYWSGRWRSSWTIDTESRVAKGKVNVDVHYYEQGNVQLATVHEPEISIPSAAGAKEIVALIEKEESTHQSGLDEAFADMSEKAFKTLRRALPLTRQKMDWDRVTGYKLGAELTASKGIFQTSDNM